MTSVTFKEKPMTLEGNSVKTGQQAPSFTVLAPDLSEKTFQPESGTKTLISVVPSVDTSVCDQQTRKLNEAVDQLGDAEIWTVSADLPFAQRRWCAAADLESAHIYSDHRDLDFGTKYGLVMKEMRLLARAVFVVDAQGTVTYSEVVPEVSSHPDYDKALDALKQA
ncbi:thiol peroxidase [Alkalicoccus urumqiensis]|uniref:Thiol peroxidase n=1 Tax=Alkalicoccus urumqiensis TaxID=1548213 RepID=A0A2P6MD79_ALKUR|nr:thiol peroxidase [Alkalicoccus urumqiensis]PRO64238.1 thiol peroxidase [Alkalicoccus urumqiensis]